MTGPPMGGTMSGSRMTGPGPGGMTGPGGGTAKPKAAKDDVAVIRLVHAKATEIGRALNSLFEKRDCNIITEERTNTLLIQADDETLRAIKNVIEQIDIPAPPSTIKPGNLAK